MPKNSQRFQLKATFWASSMLDIKLLLLVRCFWLVALMGPTSRIA